MIERYVDAAELRRLLSTLVAVLGCLTIGALFARLIVPGIRNANRPATPTAVAPVVGESGWLNPEEFPPQREVVIPPVDPATLLKPSPELMSRGKELYTGNCEQCHGPEGRGDGPAAASIRPGPRDLTGSAGWKNGPDMPGIFKTLSEGIRGTSMASFDFLAKRDRMALVHHVQALNPGAPARPDPKAAEALAAQLTAAGEVIPNRIPVSMAMAKLREEYREPPALDVGPAGASPGARVLTSVLADPGRAARFLAQQASWRKSPAELAAAVVQGAPGNGFSVGAAALTAPEWRTLYAELLSRTESE